MAIDPVHSVQGLDQVSGFGALWYMPYRMRRWEPMRLPGMALSCARLHGARGFLEMICTVAGRTLRTKPSQI